MSMNDELGQIISILRGAAYVKKRGRTEEAWVDYEQAALRVAAISWQAIPSVPFREVVISTLGPTAGNRYLIEYADLLRTIERDDDDDTEEDNLVNDPLDGLTGSKLLRLALERILEEKHLAYSELTGVKSRWDAQSENLELELIVTQRLQVVTA